MQKKRIFGLPLVVLLASCPLGPTYPGEWRKPHRDSPFSAEITRVLRNSHKFGCGEYQLDKPFGEFYYKLANGESDPGEALVYCTYDGKNWDAYLVFYKIGEVMAARKESDWNSPVSSLGAQ